MRIRPLEASDVPAAAGVSLAALPVPMQFSRDDARPWLERRTRHFLEHDPGGSWVAEEDGTVHGVALALVRDGVWGLSLMAVDPARQARGTGSRLLEAALAHGGGARAGIIASSTDPKAMRMYARAGFDLRPCVTAAGIVDRSVMPGGLAARPTEDVEAAAAIGRGVRGGAYGAHDLELMRTRRGYGLLTLGTRGFAIHHADGSPAMLCANDDEAAVDLLWSCFAAGPNGSTVHLDFITAGQDWAVQTALAAGLALSPEGPLFTRGELGPLRPWLPSGAFL